MEMRVLLEEASKNQWEVHAKTSRVKQYKEQVDSLKGQVCYSHTCKILYNYTVSHTHVLLILGIKKHHVNQF